VPKYLRLQTKAAHDDVLNDHACVYHVQRDQLPLLMLPKRSIQAKDMQFSSEVFALPFLDVPKGILATCAHISVGFARA